MAKLTFFVVGILTLLGACYGGLDQCYECKHGWEDPEVCNQTAEVVDCTGNDQFICSIEVKNEDGELGMRRRCINENACMNNQDKNDDVCYGEGNATVYNGQKCVYCCSDHDLCNYDQYEYFAGASGVVLTMWLLVTPIFATYLA